MGRGERAVDPDAGLDWAYGHGGDANEFANAIVVDPLDGIAVAGLYSGPSQIGTDVLPAPGALNTLIARFEPSGAPDWARGITSSAWVNVGKLDAVADGKTVFGGLFSATTTAGAVVLDTAGGDDAYFSHIDGAGTFAASVRFGAGGADRANGAKFTALGEAVLFGTYEGSVVVDQDQLDSLGGTDVFLIHMTQYGIPDWAISLGGTGNDDVIDLAVAANGDLILTGSFEEAFQAPGGPGLQSEGGTDIYVIRLEADGKHAWSLAAGGPGPDVGRAVAVGAGGEIGIAGEFSNDMMIGADALLSNGEVDIFVSLLEPDSTPIYALGTGGAGKDRAVGIAVDPEASAYVAATFEAKVDFGDGQIESPMGPSGVLLRYR